MTKFTFVSSLILTLSATISSYAGADNTVNKITWLRYAEDGIHVRFDVPPAPCNGGEQYRMHAVLQTGHSNYQALASGLIAAHAANKPIDFIFYLDSSVPASCNTGLLILTAIEVGE